MKLISIDEFLSTDTEDYGPYLKSFSERGRHLIGFIKWDDETACSWGGPWPGNLVLVSIVDARIRNPKALKPLGEWKDIPTTENPICLYLCGNDDTSYSTFTATIEEAEMILENIINDPTWETLEVFDFMFTN